MVTYTGRSFYPLDPRPEEVDIEDIAHALSNICRFGGHTKYFYPVSQHCVLVSRFCSKRNRLWGLLHDAPEAYAGDIIRPIKPHLSGYSRIEDSIMKAICQRFGLRPNMPQEVKKIDNQILLNEREVLITPSATPWKLETKEPLDFVLEPWLPLRAKEQFLLAFNEYSRQ